MGMLGCIFCAWMYGWMDGLIDRQIHKYIRRSKIESTWIDGQINIYTNRYIINIYNLDKFMLNWHLTNHGYMIYIYICIFYIYIYTQENYKHVLSEKMKRYKLTPQNMHVNSRQS